MNYVISVAMTVTLLVCTQWSPKLDT